MIAMPEQLIQIGCCLIFPVWPPWVQFQFFSFKCLGNQDLKYCCSTWL